jgi:hypothetical protein
MEGMGAMDVLELQALRASNQARADGAVKVGEASTDSGHAQCAAQATVSSLRIVIDALYGVSLCGWSPACGASQHVKR